MNSFIAQTIRPRAYCQKGQKVWDKLLPGIMMAYRMTPATTSEYSPYQMLFGKDMLTLLDRALISKDNLPRSVQEHLGEATARLRMTHAISPRGFWKDTKPNIRSNFDSLSVSLSGGFTPSRHLRPSLGREHKIV